MGLSWYNGFSPKLREDSWAWLKAELAAGRVPPPARCEACGETRGQLDYHTEDYSRPFGPHIHAHQLCFRCHMALHSRFRQPSVWIRYIEQLENGAVYEPLMSRREIGKIWVRGWVDRPILMTEPRGTLAFFRSLAMERQGPPADGGQMALFDLDVRPIKRPTSSPRE